MRLRSLTVKLGGLLVRRRAIQCTSHSTCNKLFLRVSDLTWHVVVCGLPAIVQGQRLKGVYSSLRETHRRATERHLPYGIAQCYLPPDTCEHA